MTIGKLQILAIFEQIKMNFQFFICLSFFTFILLTDKLSAQNYTLSNWTVEDGLSSNKIQDITQDAEGFMWIATEHGLNKFDGYEFTRYRYRIGDNNSIGANYTNQICQDNKGNIWISLGVGILSKYNKLSQSFINYSFPEVNTYISDIQFISKLGLYITTNRGLFKIKENFDTLQLMPFQIADEDFIGHLIFLRKDQHFYTNSNRGLKLYDPFTDGIRDVYFVYEKDTVEFNAPISQLYEGSDKNFWIMTEGGSICQSKDGIYFSKTEPRMERSSIYPIGTNFIHEESDELYFSSFKKSKLFHFEKEKQFWNQIPDGLASVAFTFYDQENKHWAFTKRNELFKKEGLIWKKIISLKDKLKYWEIKEVYVDNKNGIWLASKGHGLWRIYNRKWPINILQEKDAQEPFDFQVKALNIDQKENLWVGAFNNLYQYDLNKETLKPWRSNLNENPFAGLNINDIEIDEDKIWTATNHGLIIVDQLRKTNKSIKTVKINNEEIALNYVRCVTIDDSENIWIGTNKGLFIYRKDKETFYHYPSSGEQNAIKNSNIQSICQIDSNKYLVAYIKEGVDLLTLQTTDFSIFCEKINFQGNGKEQFDLMTANTFYQTEQDIWLGTFSKGLLKLDVENKLMHPLSKDFPIIPNVQGIQKGVDGNLWVSSIDGIRSINLKDQTYYRFTKSSGLSSNNFNLKSAVQDSRGNLYFGSSKGVNKIQGFKWEIQEKIATPILTEFKKYDKQVIFDKPLESIEKIELHHTDDYISFDFVSPTFDNPKGVQYAYQLEGFEKNWKYCKDQRSATYTNLAPGEYLFKVKAGNKGGFLNSKIKRIALIVNPPFWQTIWFKIFIIGLGFFIFYLIFKIQKNIQQNRLQIAADIRKKAADDFHDELGHRLTKNALFVESLMLQKDSFPKSSATLLQKIKDNSNELYYSTKDFIWAMNPSKDSALDLFVLLRDFGDELFEDTSIQFSVEGIKETQKDFLLDMDLKRQIVMIFKEAMNNVLKHSDCSNVVLKVQKEEKGLKIALSDNGKGFTPKYKEFAYGLGSMLNRSKKIGAHLEINSKEGEGTEILFVL